MIHAGTWRVSTGDYTGGQVLQVFVAALVGGFSLGQAAPVVGNFSKVRCCKLPSKEARGSWRECMVADEGDLPLILCAQHRSWGVSVFHVIPFHALCSSLLDHF